MRILIVAATSFEVASTYSHGGHHVDVLVTGIGMVATAARTSRALAAANYDVALNLGVCGSFDRSLPPGTVVHVISDGLSEVGAEDGDAFLSLQELGLPGDEEFPFTKGRLVNRMPPSNPVLDALRPVRGITVNTVHGNERSIAAVVRRLDPQVESMEGAAFMYACAIHGLPHAQVRAVSNIVERRNREAWMMSEAIARLTECAGRLLDSI